MAHQIPWTRTLLEEFIKEGMLTEDEETIMRTRVAGWSIVKQAAELNISRATVCNYIRKLKDKYDCLHKLYPDKFPQRKQSKYEQLMDNYNDEQTVKNENDEQVMHAEKDKSTINNEKKENDLITCEKMFPEIKTSCGKDISNMTAKEIVECQRNCAYKCFYKEID